MNGVRFEKRGKQTIFPAAMTLYDGCAEHVVIF
jgi:hypothetical protein